MKEYDMAAGDTLLVCENVKKGYGDFTLDCSIELKKGRVTGLIGKNGAGKTTLFKAVLGLISIDKGRIFWEEKEVAGLDEKMRSLVGVVLSDSFFSGYLQVTDICAIMEQLYPTFDKKVFTDICKKYSIPLNKAIRNFSTGMKAKLKVLCALAHNTKLLILDEPTLGLDVVARDEILQLLREYMEQEEDRAVLISSHISGDLESLCDDIYMIDDGKIVLHEETDVLLSSYGILKVTKEQYALLDKDYILRIKEEPFGYRILTDQKKFYQENYPKLAIEKGNIDELIFMMVSGRKNDGN